MPAHKKKTQATCLSFRSTTPHQTSPTNASKSKNRDSSIRTEFTDRQRQQHCCVSLLSVLSSCGSPNTLSFFSLPPSLAPPPPPLPLLGAPNTISIFSLPPSLPLLGALSCLLVGLRTHYRFRFLTRRRRPPPRSSMTRREVRTHWLGRRCIPYMPPPPGDK